MTDMLSEEHQAWLEERGIDLEVVTRYGLYTDRQGHNGRDLVIPYRRDDKIVNRKYRGPQKRFRQDPGAPRMFWNEDSLRDATLANEPLVVTEGELDALAAIQAGFPRAVSVPDGAGSNLEFIGKIWPLIKDVGQVILCGDGDEPGRKLNSELARRFGAVRCAWVAYPDGTKDLGDILRLKGEEAVGDALRGAMPYPVKGLYKLSDYPDVAEPILREHYCRKQPNDLTIDDKRTADDWIEDSFYFIDQDPREEQEEATVDWLIDKAGDAVVRYGVDWFLLDPWNQIEHRRQRNETEADYQGKAIASLKRFARSYDCGVIVVAHPTKDVKLPNGEIRQPTLYDISGSAHWFNAADHGVIICGDTTSNVREVMVEKSRYRAGRAPGSAWLRLEDGRLRSTASP